MIGTQRAAYIQSSDHLIRSTAPPTTSTKAITKSPSHFGFWILRLSSPRQARGLSLSKAVQVLDCRLSEQEKPNRIRNVLFMYFSLNRFMVLRSQFRFEPETRNLKPFKLASTDTSRARATEAARCRGSREYRRRSCNRTPALPKATDKIPTARIPDPL